LRSSPLQKTIAVIRIFTAVLFLLFGWYKLFTPAFAHGGFEQYISGYVQDQAVGFYRGFLSGVVLPHPVLFAYMVGILELLIGLSLLVGFWVRAASLLGALLAELTRNIVVCDFRSRDIAAGGEGAPLVPSFHQAMFANAKVHRVIVNIGGIANLTDLGSVAIQGFDTGPGNMLMDAWIQRHLGKTFDRDGEWAQGGSCIHGILHKLIDHEFFPRIPPKSTGRELFNLAWLDKHLSGKENPRDVQATLLDLTALSIARAIETHCNGVEEVYVCGGGAANPALMSRLSAALSGVPIATTAKLGIDPDWVEACAFAWLARQALLLQPGNLPSVTGATGPRILGAIYPA